MTEKIVETDVEWTKRIAALVREQTEVEEIEQHEDSPERIASNEFFFYTRYSDEWPAMRVVVEPVAGSDQSATKQFKVTWCQIPTNYNAPRTTILEARNADVARAFVKDHIERTTGIARTEFAIQSVEEYEPPEEAKVISG